MPTGLEIAALGAMAVGAAVSAASSVASGYAQKDALDYNARVAEMHATAAEQSAALDEETSRKRTARVQGTVRARAAGAGLDITEGSPLDVLAENAAEGELDALTARYSGAVEASRARSQANLARYQGKQAVINGWVGAGAQLLQSAGGAYKMYGGGSAGSSDFVSTLPASSRSAYSNMSRSRPWGDL